MWHYLLFDDVIGYFARSKCQKLEKLTKIAKIEKENHIFWTTWGILMKFLGKM